LRDFVFSEVNAIVLLSVCDNPAATRGESPSFLKMLQHFQEMLERK
jgi:hypothetical protein